MQIINFLKCKGNTKKNVCVCLCIFFIIFCFFMGLVGCIEPDWFNDVYSMYKKKRTALIIVYVFAIAIIAQCIFILIALKQESKREILIWLLLTLAFWQVHLIICFVTLVSHTIETQVFHASQAFLRTLPLLCFQAVWLYMISMLWYYWRELVSQPDVPNYIRFLLLKRKRKRAIREDQRERLGNLPTRFLDALVPPIVGIASANAL